MTTYNTTDYIASVERELAKRATTYPKMVAKKRKQGMPTDELERFEFQLGLQKRDLRNVEIIMNRPSLWRNLDENDRELYALFGNELRRELKMRKKVYPRLIYFKRINQETADFETAVWQSLCDWWAEKFEKNEN